MSTDCPVVRRLARGAAGLRWAARRDRRAARRLAAGPLADARARLAQMQAEVDELAEKVARLDTDAAAAETAATLTMRHVAPRVRERLVHRIAPDAKPDPGALGPQATSPDPVPAPAEVWSPLDAPGGYVCAAPVAAHARGIDLPDGRRVCGIPTESVPCDQHGPDDEPDDPLVTMPDRREATPPPAPTGPSPRHAAPAEPSHTLTGPLRALVGLVTGRTGGHPVVTDGPEALAALTALDTTDPTGDSRA